MSLKTLFQRKDIRNSYSPVAHRVRIRPEQSWKLEILAKSVMQSVWDSSILSPAVSLSVDLTAAGVRDWAETLWYAITDILTGILTSRPIIYPSKWFWDMTYYYLLLCETYQLIINSCWNGWVLSNLAFSKCIHSIVFPVIRNILYEKPNLAFTKWKTI